MTSGTAMALIPVESSQKQKTATCWLIVLRTFPSVYIYIHLQISSIHLHKYKFTRHNDERRSELLSNYHDIHLPQVNDVILLHGNRLHHQLYRSIANRTYSLTFGKSQRNFTQTSQKLHKVVYQTLHTRTWNFPQTSLQTAKTSVQTLKTSLQTSDKRYKSERHWSNNRYKSELRDSQIYTGFATKCCYT